MLQNMGVYKYSQSRENEELGRRMPPLIWGPGMSKHQEI